MMKKLSISLIIALMTMISLGHAQTQNTKQNSSTDNSIIEKATYRLFPTENIWNFIKLNTRNGEMWQVQWSTGTDNRFVTALSLEPLVGKDEEKNGRFTLQATQNINTFILLDQLDGRTWQVQWAVNPEKRGIIPIN
ncbi:MAG: hypothetical protein AAGC65_07870 [Mucilaginibacter sp.]|uniref:hypothetical protein n=1 Tax=Mucilaginibacter sp. TaxID=1882438 RepID=UPI0031AF81D1